jgi:hypothetical protein
MPARVRLPGAFDRIVVSSRGSRLDSTSVSPREGSRTSRRPATRRDVPRVETTGRRDRRRRGPERDAPGRRTSIALDRDATHRRRDAPSTRAVDVSRRDGAECIGRTFASSRDVTRDRFPRARRRGFEISARKTGDDRSRLERDLVSNVNGTRRVRRTAWTRARESDETARTMVM